MALSGDLKGGKLADHPARDPWGGVAQVSPLPPFSLAQRKEEEHPPPVANLVRRGLCQRAGQGPHCPSSASFAVDSSGCFGRERGE